MYPLSGTIINLDEKINFNTKLNILYLKIKEKIDKENIVSMIINKYIINIDENNIYETWQNDEPNIVIDTCNPQRDNINLIDKKVDDIIISDLFNKPDNNDIIVSIMSGSYFPFIRRIIDFICVKLSGMLNICHHNSKLKTTKHKDMEKFKFTELLNNYLNLRNDEKKQKENLDIIKQKENLDIIKQKENLDIIKKNQNIIKNNIIKAIINYFNYNLNKIDLLQDGDSELIKAYLEIKRDGGDDELPSLADKISILDFEWKYLILDKLEELTMNK